MSTLLPRNSIAASAGSLDASFDVGSGASSGVNVVLPQPDGKVIIAGSFSYYYSTFCQGIARLNPDASLDSTPSMNPTPGRGRPRAPDVAVPGQPPR